MSQRPSGYARVANDVYITPRWVTECLLGHIPSHICEVYDPAVGTGAIVDVLNGPFKAFGRDLSEGYDFLDDNGYYEAIVTNPPYGQAENFIAKAIANASYVAMLLRTDYDHAKTRRYLFKNHPWFAKEIKLNQRIVFIERTDGIKPAPSFWHSWFIWNKHHLGPATIAYAP